MSRLQWARERRLFRLYPLLAALFLLLLVCMWTPAFSQALLLMLRSEMVFSHLFYLPVALAALVWGLRGVWIAVLIGCAWIAAYFLSGVQVPPQEYFPQPIMFMLIGATVGVLREQALRTERDLRKRVNELHCLFNLASLRDRVGLTADEILQGTVDLIPPAWQYPQSAYARLVLEGRTFATSNYAETPWRQTCVIVLNGEQVGTIEVGYLDPQPTADEGPFLQEEQYLLAAIAERIGKFLQREQVETALQRSEFTNRALINAIPDAIWHIHADGTLLGCKAAKEGPTLGIDTACIGQPVRMVLPPDLTEQVTTCTTQALQTDKIQICEQELAVHGVTHTFEARFVASGEAEVLAIVRDITDRKAREALVEEERLRIAQDLHDGLAQALYFVGLKLDYLRKQVSRDPDRTVAELHTLKQTIQTSIQEVRRTIFALRPIDLEKQGFDPAIRQYANAFGEHMGLHVKVDVEPLPEQIPTMLELTFFRLVQEGLNNIAKHAQARQVWIDLRVAAERVGHLTIRDDGIGFDPHMLSDTINGKFGLSQMRERVLKLGGDFRIESTPASGTTLRTQIPL